MRKGVLLSGLLHLAVVLIAFFGLPSFFEPVEVQPPISVRVVDIAEVTTPPKQEKPAPEQAKPEPPKPEPPKPAAQQEPPPPAPAPPVEPKQEPEPPTPEPPEPEPVVAPTPPEPVPEPKLEPEPEPEVAKVEPLPVPKTKPKPPEKKVAAKKVVEKKPEEPKEKEPEPEPEERSFTSVLKNVEKLKQEAAARPEPAPEPAPEAAAAERNLSNEPLTLSEIDAIRAQIERCWIVDPGMKGIENITVEIVTKLNPDGSVNQAYWKDQSRYNSDNLYRVLAESARRAVLKCSPLQVPQKKYETWKEVTLVFNAREMLGL